MIRAHSIDVVRAAEAAAMAELPEGELMRRAAEGLAEVAVARLEERDGRTVVALVGAGNNGGDTLYAAQHLSEAGFACVAVLLASTGRVGTHAAGLEAAEAAGVIILVGDAALAAVAEADLVLDGIVGIGARPGLRPETARLVDAIGDDAWVIAVDLASGLDPAGEVGDDDSVWADETVTFGTPKPAHLLPAGEAASGRLTVVDIGLEVDDLPAAVERLTYDDGASRWPVPGPTDDKYSRGVLGVVAGGEGYSGAAVLSVTAAVEAGIGMVRYVGTPTPTRLVRSAVPEAVHGDGRVQAWLIGPGLDVDVDVGAAANGDATVAADGSLAAAANRDATAGGSAEQLRVARAALASDLPVVVDAGGLDLIAGSQVRRAGPTLLTPHAGELARLLTRLRPPDARPDPAGSTDRNETPESGLPTLGTGGDPVDRPAVTRDDVLRDPVGSARRLAELTGATVLLKGATTLVVSPDPADPVRSQAEAPAWLATAGAGDVLSGIVGMLLASGLSPLDAGSLGALVHGVSADLASAGGPIRALAVATGIPLAVRHLLTRD